MIKKQEPVAEVVSMHGDPEAFGERRLSMNVDIQTMPYGTKFYTTPQPCPKCASLDHQVSEGHKNTLRLESVIRDFEAQTKELETLSHQSNQDHLNARKDYQATITQQAERIAELEAERDELAAQVTHWRANHASVVEQARILKERPDMPIERVKAYENWVAMAAQVEKMKEALLWCHHVSGYVQASGLVDRIFALPDLSSGILNRVRAEAINHCIQICKSHASTQACVEIMAANMEVKNV